MGIAPWTGKLLLCSKADWRSAINNCTKVVTCISQKSITGLSINPTSIQQECITEIIFSEQIYLVGLPFFHCPPTLIHFEHFRVETDLAGCNLFASWKKINMLINIVLPVMTVMFTNHENMSLIVDNVINFPFKAFSILQSWF